MTTIAMLRSRPLRAVAVAAVLALVASCARSGPPPQVIETHRAGDASGTLPAGAVTPTQPSTQPTTQSTTSSGSPPSTVSPAAGSSVSPASTPGSIVTSGPGAPVVGECRGPANEATIDPPTDPRPTVPCSGPHGSETIAVGQLPSDITSWPAATSTVSTELDGIIESACTPALAAYVGLPTVDSPQQMVTKVSFAFYLPTKAEFDAGGRWFRCDAIVALLDGENETTIPGTLKDAFANGGAKPELLVCEAAAGDRVPCNLPHRAELLETEVLPDPPTAPYPGNAALGQRVDELCMARVLVLLAQTGKLRDDLTQVSYWPTQDDWEGTGDRTVLCGVAAVGDHLISGTARGIGTGALKSGGITA